MILNGPGKISIMVDGQVVGMTAKPIHIVTENYTKAEAIAEAADVKRSFEITGNAIVTEPSQALHDIWNDMMSGKMDVTIEQKVGKLPRKMKKALHSKRMSKWKQKVVSYISRRQDVPSSLLPLWPVLTVKTYTLCFSRLRNHLKYSQSSLYPL